MGTKLKRLIWVVALSLFLVSNWLIDFWGQGISTTMGYWSNMFNLTTIQSFHIAWYSMILIGLVSLSANIMGD